VPEWSCSQNCTIASECLTLQVDMSGPSDQVVHCVRRHFCSVCLSYDNFKILDLESALLICRPSLYTKVTVANKAKNAVVNLWLSS